MELVRARFAPSHRHGRTALAECADTLAAVGVATGETIWLDTETTGLAGGTGTHVFLVGVGGFEGGSFTVEQYLLRRLSAEGRFLSLVQARLGRARHLVTFNGRRFDWPLLEARFVLARLSAAALDAHTDLIQPARRLWHRVFGTHRLSTLEAELLGAARGNDIPGWMIPQVYVQYLRTADRTSLEPILAHNRADLLALLGLHARVARVLQDPDGLGPIDWEGAGVLLGRAGDQRRAARCFERALGGARGAPASELWRVLRRCVRAYRACGEEDRVRDVWEWAAGATGGAGRYRAQVLAELARARERAGDLEGARDAAVAALQAGGALSTMPLFVAGLHRRVDRLSRYG